MNPVLAANRPLPLIDLQAQRRHLGTRIDAAIARVLEHGQFILGPEVSTLEQELAAFCGAQHVVSCANGTDALGLVLMAKGVGPGDAILCPSFSFAATAEVVVWTGATPVFVDVLADTYNIDPESLARGIGRARELGLRPVGVIPVDLFGQPADYVSIEALCEREGLWLLADAAQSFGASCNGRKVGTFGVATATSFFPSKPLACYGDGGAVFTEDAALAEVLRSLRVHGQGADKYENVRIGMNARMDTLQAAILLEKLRVFPDEIVTRNAIADRYDAALADCAVTPRVAAGMMSVWAHYTLRVPAAKRERVQAALRDDGIAWAIYYLRPLHQQVAYRSYPTSGNGLPVSEMLSAEVLSLPMHAYLSEDDQARIIAVTRQALG